MSNPITAYQAKYYAHELQRSYANDHVGKLAGLLFDAQVEPKPHQIDAALFALQTPFLPGVILADEVGENVNPTRTHHGNLSGTHLGVLRLG